MCIIRGLRQRPLADPPAVKRACARPARPASARCQGLPRALSHSSLVRGKARLREAGPPRQCSVSGASTGAIPLVFGPRYISGGILPGIFVPLAALEVRSRPATKSCGRNISGGILPGIFVPLAALEVRSRPATKSCGRNISGDGHGRGKVCGSRARIRWIRHRSAVWVSIGGDGHGRGKVCGSRARIRWIRHRSAVWVSIGGDGQMACRSSGMLAPEPQSRIRRGGLTPVPAASGWPAALPECWRRNLNLASAVVV